MGREIAATFLIEEFTSRDIKSASEGGEPSPTEKSPTENSRCEMDRAKIHGVIRKAQYLNTFRLKSIREARRINLRHAKNSRRALRENEMSIRKECVVNRCLPRKDEE